MFVNSQDIRFGILKDAYDRTKKQEPLLMTPEQYSSELGVSANEIALHLRYLIDHHFLNGTVETFGGGLVIFNVVSITGKGIDAVEHPNQFTSAPIGGTTINVQGPMIGSQMAVGSNISQSQTSAIGTFQEAYNYVESKFSKQDVEEILPLLKAIQAGVERDTLSPSKLTKTGELLAKYGPVAIPVLDFVLRTFGLKTGGGS
jgi:hypothetical protein